MCRLLTEGSEDCVACGAPVAPLSHEAFRERKWRPVERWNAERHGLISDNVVVQMGIILAALAIWAGVAFALLFGIGGASELSDTRNLVAIAATAVWLCGFPFTWQLRRRRTPAPLGSRIRPARDVTPFERPSVPPAREGVAREANGYARRISDDCECLASSFVVSDGDGTLVRGWRSVDWAVVDESGNRTIVLAPMWVFGSSSKATLTSDIEQRIGVPNGLSLRGALREVTVVEGSRVRVFGEHATEVVDSATSGYRDMPTIQLVRGRPGAPVRVEVVGD